MPVPKGVDKKKYDRCVDKVKRRQDKQVNAYAVCASSLKKDEGEKCMSDKMKKALTAGYEADVAPEKVEEVNAGASLKAPEPQPTAPAAETKVPEAPATPAKDVKFNGNLFKPYTLGATLRPQPHGNVMSGVKPSKVDYVQTEKQSIRQETFVLDENGQPTKKQ